MYILVIHHLKFWLVRNFCLWSNGNGNSDFDENVIIYTLLFPGIFIIILTLHQTQTDQWKWKAFSYIR